MELFFFLLISIIGIACYLFGVAKPTIQARMTMVLCMLFLALSLNQTGLILPNTGATFSGSTITFTSTTYTLANNPILFALFWFLFPLSVALYGENLSLMLSRRVKPDGRII